MGEKVHPQRKLQWTITLVQALDLGFSAGSI
jgi:hypothetical protein